MVIAMRTRCMTVGLVKPHDNEPGEEDEEVVDEEEPQSKKSKKPRSRGGGGASMNKTAIKTEYSRIYGYKMTSLSHYLQWALVKSNKLFEAFRRMVHGEFKL